MEVTVVDASRLTPELAFLLDKLGVGSAKAQELPSPITTGDKLRASDHRLYLWQDGQGGAGFIKVGTKHLFYMSNTGEYSEMDPLCVLDFYVQESCQRGGVGIGLFHAMQQNEGGVEAKDLAYDRPSSKLLPFLRKHFGLADFFPQPNRYVIFDDNGLLPAT